MADSMVDSILTGASIERIVILLMVLAIVGLYRRANHLADQRVNDVQAALEKSNAALSENTRTLDTMATRLEAKASARG